MFPPNEPFNGAAETALLPIRPVNFRQITCFNRAHNRADNMRVTPFASPRNAIGGKEKLGGARLSLCLFRLQKRQDLFDERVSCNAVFLPQDRDCTMFDELIGPSDPDNRRVYHLRMQMLHDGASKPVVENMILD